MTAAKVVRPARRQCSAYIHLLQAISKQDGSGLSAHVRLNFVVNAAGLAGQNDVAGCGTRQKFCTLAGHGTNHLYARAHNVHLHAWAQNQDLHARAQSYRLQACVLDRVGPNRIHTPYRTVYTKISLLKALYMHRKYVPTVPFRYHPG